MKNYLVKIIISSAVLILFTACGSDDSNNNTSVSYEKIWSDLSNLPDFIYSETELINPLGLYGNDVYFGNQAVVGSWVLYDAYIGENGSAIQNKPLYSYEFYQDGTGVIKNHGLSPITYGVVLSAYTLSISRNDKSGLVMYSIYGQQNNCFLVRVHTTYFYGKDLNLPPSFLCKVD